MARIQLELPESRISSIKELMEVLGVETYKDLFNNALSLLDWTVEQVQDGRIIAALKTDDNKYKELVMPVLQHAARQARVLASTGAANARG